MVLFDTQFFRSQLKTKKLVQSKNYCFFTVEIKNSAQISALVKWIQSMICDEIENFEDSDSEDSGEEVFQDCMECGSPTSHGISLDKANSGGTDGASPDTDPTHTTSGTATDSTAGSGTSENSTAASTENTSGTPTSGTSDTASEREHDGAPADSGGAAHNDASSHGDSSGPPGDGDEDGSSIKKGKGRRGEPSSISQQIISRLYLMIRDQLHCTHYSARIRNLQRSRSTKGDPLGAF